MHAFVRLAVRLVSCSFLPVQHKRNSCVLSRVLFEKGGHIRTASTWMLFPTELSLPMNALSSCFDLIFAFVNQRSGKRDARGGLMVMASLGVEALDLSKPTESF